ncbi:MAG: Abi family protein [Daejeonella sp.]
MANKPALSVADQIILLKSRGMLFDDEPHAIHFLKNVSYYRLKGYWWDQQVDSSHNFKPDTCFDDIIIRYNFEANMY